MFKNEFQGGPCVEIFSANGKDPLNKWKNPALKRQYEKEVKGYTFILEGSTTTAKLSYPLKDAKHQVLALIQRYFVMQVYIPLAKDFAVELAMTDIKSNKRRVVLSTSVKDISMTPLHAKLPLSLVKRDVWLNLCLDLVSLISDVFFSQTYKSLEAFSLSGNCKIRRIFTLKSQPFETAGSEDQAATTASCESIPTSLQFSSNVPFHTQVVSVHNIKQHLGPKSARGDVRDTSDYWSSSSDDLSSSRRFSARDQGPTHIAFGTKVPFDPIRSARGKHGSSSARRDRSSPWDSTDNRASRNSARKIRSSNARLSSRNSSADKENSAADPNLGVQVGSSPLATRDVGQKFKPLSNIPRRKPEDANISALPLALADLVAEVDTNDDMQLPATDAQTRGTPDSDVYVFSSQPRSAPKARPDSGSAALQDARKHGEDFERSPADSDDGDDVMDRADSRGDAVGNLKFSRHGSSVAGIAPNRSISEPMSSMSPDISRVKSPSSQRIYSSAKYTDNERKFSSVLSKKPPISQNASLRSSDATLTASVDTLVQQSTRQSNEEFVESVDEKSARRHVPLESDTSPPKAQSRQFSGSQVSVLLNRKSIREIQATGPVAKSVPESSTYQVGDWSDSFEAQMLASMKREAEEEMVEEDAQNLTAGEETVNYQDQYEDSFDASWSTYRNPPAMQPQAYDSEMKNNDPSFQPSNTLNGFTLMQSNPRDWANLMSPPTVLPSVRAKQKKESLSDVESVGNELDSMGLSDGSSVASVKSSNTGDTTDEEEMLDLLYDPCLNCYFDPKTGKYYELKH